MWNSDRLKATRRWHDDRQVRCWSRRRMKPAAAPSERDDVLLSVIRYRNMFVKHTLVLAGSPCDLRVVKHPHSDSPEPRIFCSRGLGTKLWKTCDVFIFKLYNTSSHTVRTRPHHSVRDLLMSSVNKWSDDRVDSWQIKLWTCPLGTVQPRWKWNHTMNEPLTCWWRRNTPTHGSYWSETFI